MSTQCTIYIDEAGDLGINRGTRWFVLTSVIVNKESELNIRNILSSAVFTLKPAIAEEVIFRFFLLAYACCQLYGKVEKRFFNIYIYTLMIIPHELLHYPDLFIESPGFAVVMCILNGLLFGLPMALLMKRKNLQMAIGMHWFIDFARFVAGF